MSNKPTEIYTSLDTYEKFKACIHNAVKAKCSEMGRSFSADRLSRIKMFYKPNLHDSEINRIIEEVLH